MKTSVQWWIMKINRIFAVMVLGYSMAFVSVGDTHRQPQSGTTGIALKIIDLPDNHPPSDWDRVVQKWESLPRMKVPADRQQLVIDQLRPWIARVLTDEFRPFASKQVEIDRLIDETRGDVYWVSYRVHTFDVTILDSSKTITLTVRSARAEGEAEDGIVAEWQNWVRRFLRDPDRFDKPSSLHCWRTTDALYVRPTYLTSARFGREEFWWYDGDYKFSKQEVRASFGKLFDAEHPDHNDTTYGVTNRYDRLTK